MSDTTKKKVKRTLNIVMDVFLVLFLLVSAFILIFALSQRSGKVSQIFGYTVRSVQSESMERYDASGNLVDGAFCKGDVIICKVTDKGPYRIGDVVLFSMPITTYPDGSYTECAMTDYYEQTILVTHRIIGTVTENGFIRYRTQGLASPVEDINTKMDVDILAIYTGIRIPYVGSVMDFLQTTTGFFLCIILPMLAFVLFQAYRVVNNVILYNREKALQEATEAAEVARTADLTEDEKRRIAEEYLKSLSQGTPSTDGSQPKGTEE